MNKNLKANKSGFTIIEVLIVLAIAALIMLIVFIAVPSLRRNARNNEIRGNAARLATAGVEFRTNANGTAPSSAADATTLANMAGITPTSSVSMGVGATATPATFRVIGASGGCTGTTANASGGDPRAVSVQFGLEGGGTGCIVN